MKDAIEAATNELKDWKTKLETMRSEIAKWNSRHERAAQRTETVFSSGSRR